MVSISNLPSLMTGEIHGQRKKADRPSPQSQELGTAEVANTKPCLDLAEYMRSSEEVALSATFESVTTS